MQVDKLNSKGSFRLLITLVRNVLYALFVPTALNTLCSFPLVIESLGASLFVPFFKLDVIIAHLRRDRSDRVSEVRHRAVVVQGREWISVLVDTLRGMFAGRNTSCVEPAGSCLSAVR